MAPVVLTSRIEAVTVYRAGALVRRVAQLPAEIGDGFTAELGDLPLALLDESVRVSVEGSSSPPVATNVHISLTAGERDLAKGPPDDAELQAARKDEARIELNLSQLKAARGRIRGLESPGRPQAEPGHRPPPSPTKGRAALLEFRKAELERLHTAIGAAKEDLRRAREQRQELQRLFDERSSARQAREHELRKRAVVPLRAGETTGSARLVLEYAVPGARWAPSYAVRLGSDLSAAEISVRAMVSQCSGEDWTDARVTLSTANMQQWCELPELLALRYGRRQPAPARRGYREPPAGAEALFADYDRAFGRAPGAASPQASRRRDVQVFDKEVSKSAFDDGGDFDEEWDDDSEVAEEIAVLEDVDSFGAGVAVGAVMASEAAPPMPVAAPAPAPPRGAPMKKGKARPRAAAGSFDRTRNDARREEPPAELTAAVDQLDYGSLRLAAPDAAGRGKLSRASRSDLYLELLVQQRVEVHFDLVQVLGRAHSTAQGPGQLRLPEGYWPPSSEGGFDYAYPADHPLTVPSDGEFHLIELSARSTDCTPRYIAVPREQQDVFRQVDLDNPLEAPLPRGPADIYVDGVYLMTAPLDATVARGRMELGLGVEQRIKVSRNTKFDEEAAGLIGGSRELNHGISIEIRNLLEREATVEVRERVPVGREKDDDVKVTVERVEPDWQDWDPEGRHLRGGHRWTVPVPAGESRTVEVDYAIRIPKGNELAGGNRREA